MKYILLILFFFSFLSESKNRPHTLNHNKGNPLSARKVQGDKCSQTFQGHQKRLNRESIHFEINRLASQLEFQTLVNAVSGMWGDFKGFLQKNKKTSFPKDE